MARPKESHNRREIIVQAGRKLFGRYGIEKTTVDEIAREAGVSKGAIYLEFPSKDEILLAGVREFSAREYSTMTAEMADAKPPILQSMRKILSAFLMRTYDNATSQVHTPEVLMHTHNRVKAETGHMQMIRDVTIELFYLADVYKEIAVSHDRGRLADLLMASLATLIPPYPQNSTVFAEEFKPRDSFQADVSDLLEIFLAGLTVKG
ncbi:MAG: TetR/AcrR family transcriptional regulator [Cyanobacteria bacterium SZAS LIN-2]|nr:TetR/AcrR family transcriptional regulator [Cyanobacteria bacterium SZAS LIN-3]MBS1997681.1 TetR/AcrR family transcriptional regulator [Cyanobacteria bacterium SZAS LIN-2]MBS2006107.1 TetR/AcrR family transcriptional regulator [Cyanobacteria bacterium SZAS TMP-1]